MPSTKKPPNIRHGVPGHTSTKTCPVCAKSRAWIAGKLQGLISRSNLKSRTVRRSGKS